MCASYGTYEIKMFSLDLNTHSESLPMTDAGSEFQTDGAAIRKERFGKSVRANGWMRSVVAVERSVRALTWRLMRCLPWYRVQTCSESCTLKVNCQNTVRTLLFVFRPRRLLRSLS